MRLLSRERFALLNISGCRPRRRSGSATLWVILFLPLFLPLFCFVIEISNLWLARVELENSLEAAALAAVKQWGDENGGLGTSDARNVGVNYAAVNTVGGVSVELGPNLGVVAANNPNLNKLCLANKSDMDLARVAPDGNLVFGAISENPFNVLIFDAREAPSCGAPCGVFIKVTGNQDDLKTCDGWKICFEDCDDDALLKKIVIDISNSTNPPPGVGWQFQNAKASPGPDRRT